MMNFRTLINTVSNTPNGYLINLSANCKVILVRFNSCKSNCLATIKGINYTLALKSYNALKNSMLSIVHGIEKLPGFFNFGGSLFCMMALHFSINTIVSQSSNFLFRIIISLKNFAYEGICKIALAKGILICNYLKILTKSFKMFVKLIWIESLRKWNHRRHWKMKIDLL